ncbi:hypothetical protein [Flavobacterium sp. JP2137]|uniref:hypothetical protein n=1 Tax=Flavobacterium sp. JP2137 TaxID=3414510 RepID=UPI003D2FBA9A
MKYLYQMQRLAIGLSIAWIAVVISGFSTVITPNPLGKGQTKRLIKSIKERHFEPVEQAGKTLKGTPKMSVLNLPENHTRYNRLGHIVEEIIYTPVQKHSWIEGKKSKEIVHTQRHATYTYKGKNQLVEKWEYSEFMREHKKYTFTYDVLGILETVVWADGDGKLLGKERYHYDAETNTTTKHSYSGLGNLESQVIYKRDERGEDLEIHRCDAKGELQESYYFSSTYDEQGLLLEYCRSSGFEGMDLGQKTTVKYQYQQGVLAEESVYDSQDQLEERMTYTYLSFDREGNWTRRILHHNGLPESFVEREIHYFR